MRGTEAGSDALTGSHTHALGKLEHAYTESQDSHLYVALALCTLSCASIKCSRALSYQHLAVLQPSYQCLAISLGHARSKDINWSP